MKIAIIGAGQLGSRHLQAMALLDTPAEVTVLDPSTDSLSMAKKRFDKINENNKLPIIKYINNYSDIPLEIDIAIIATTADVRRKAIECLLDQSEVKFLILEKILFQRLNDFLFIQSLMKEKNISAWVNCPQRTWGIYKELSVNLEPNEIIELNVSGCGWGLACNSIHYIDLFSFLSKSHDITFSTDMLLNSIADSKREGFIELYGKFKGSNSRGDSIALTCYQNGNAPLIVQVLTPSLRYIIKESNRSVLFSCLKDDWRWNEKAFKVPFQSQQTQKIIKEIISTNNCPLPSLEESTRLHMPMIKAFLSFLSKKTKKDVSVCQIT